MIATLHNAVQSYELIEPNKNLEKTTLDLNQKLSDANSQLDRQLKQLAADKKEIDEAHDALKTNFGRS